MALPEGLELDPLGDWSIQGRHTFFLPAKMDRIAGWLDKDWVRLWGWGWVRVWVWVWVWVRVWYNA